MTAKIDLFFSFRSPYSYLATYGALNIPTRYDATVVLRPVLPLALRDASFFNPSGFDRVKYILIDWERRAKMLGVPHKWPSPDPIVQDMKTFKVSEDQPYIYRLSMLGVEAKRRGRGLEFAAEVARLIFGGTRDWHQGDHLADAVRRAGLELASMEAVIEDGASHMHEIEKNQVEQLEKGHRGVPLFVYNDEPFFGQDRIDSLCWQLKRDGVERASTG